MSPDLSVKSHLRVIRLEVTWDISDGHPAEVGVVHDSDIRVKSGEGVRGYLGVGIGEGL